jgi:hypothetical protein
MLLNTAMQDKYTMNLKRIAHFFWNDPSPIAQLAQLAAALVVIVFIIYPTIGFALQTPLPLVAVVSGSMEQDESTACVRIDQFGTCLEQAQLACGKKVTIPINTFADFWQYCNSTYTQYNITAQQFATFTLPHGFYAGDAIIVYGKNPQNVQVGNVIVWQSLDGIPIIHRVVNIQTINDTIYFTTKGDHNPQSIASGPRQEIRIHQDQYKGTALLVIPYMGYPKYLLTKLSGISE